MNLHIIQLDKRTASALMPDVQLGALNNKGREEALTTIIPNIKLQPKGGFWFIVLAESEEARDKFLAFGKAKGLFIAVQVKKEKDKRVIDLTDYNYAEMGVSKEKVFHMGKAKVRSKQTRELEEQKDHEQESIKREEENMRLWMAQQGIEAKEL